MSEHATDAPPLRLPVRRQSRMLLLLAVVAIVLVALIAIARGSFSAPPSAPPPPPGDTVHLTKAQFARLDTVVVGSGTDPNAVSATGLISVDEDRSTPVLLPYSGQVGDVFVQAGQRVTQGQPLLKIASPDFVEARNTLFAADAQRTTAAAQLQIATDNEKRQDEIYRSAGGAFKDYRQSQTDLVAARSQLRSADAAVGAARDKLALLGKTPAEIGNLEKAGEVAGIYSQTTFHAPVSGTIASRDVAPGQYISVGGDKPLLVITDPTRVWLVAQVDQSDASRIRLGDLVDVTTPAYPGRVFHASVDNIGAALDPDTHRLPVRATVANPGEELKPAMFATFTIRGRPTDVASQALLVPSMAVIHEGDAARVWVVERNGVLRARPVTVIDSANGMDRIGTGLAPGDRVVRSGAIFVNEAGLD